MKYALVALGVLAAGCAAYERADLSRKARLQMIGMRQDHLRQCAGRPKRIDVRGETEIWTYESGGKDPRTGDEPLVFGGAISSEASPIPRRYCVIRVFVDDGRVSRVEYRGVTGGAFSKGEQCAFVVANCIK